MLIRVRYGGHSASQFQHSLESRALVLFAAVRKESLPAEQMCARAGFGHHVVLRAVGSVKAPTDGITKPPRWRSSSLRMQFGADAISLDSVKSSIVVLLVVLELLASYPLQGRAGCTFCRTRCHQMLNAAADPPHCSFCSRATEKIAFSVWRDRYVLLISFPWVALAP